MTSQLSYKFYHVIIGPLIVLSSQLPCYIEPHVEILIQTFCSIWLQANCYIHYFKKIYTFISSGVLSYKCIKFQLCLCPVDVTNGQSSVICHNCQLRGLLASEQGTSGQKPNTLKLHKTWTVIEDEISFWHIRVFHCVNQSKLHFHWSITINDSNAVGQTYAAWTFMLGNWYDVFYSLW